MSDLSYSVDAKNVIHLFHGVSKIVYVEGDDDIPFWETIFNKLAPYTVKVEEVGGKEEVQKYINDILSDNANFIVARDADYDAISGKIEHPNIIYTYGHSIENSLVNSSILNKVIRNVCRLRNNEVPSTLSSDWINEISEAVAPLVYHDIINELDGLGVSVLNKSCEQFLVSRNNYKFCEKKINAYLEQLPFQVDETRIEESGNLIDERGLSIVDILRGHFLFSAAYYFIKHTVRNLRRKTSISLDMLYSNLLTAFEMLFDRNHPHYGHYKIQIDNTG